MGVFMLVAIPATFIAIIGAFLLWTIIKSEKERNRRND